MTRFWWMGMNTQWQGLTADSSAALRNDKQKGGQRERQEQLRSLWRRRLQTARTISLEMRIQWKDPMVGLCMVTDI
jgi:hypothetical protein